ncbi:(2Fe-2S) ferredoxin domain-containing protein [Capillibacterium thermochitinicola]|uniref:(2Fe-2S) ferredoxin domain-containing protein n=1 Tax=Capillibacterium thermochitinicola TaxID=2699427 RepID=A0A8J6HSY8_9FIRM|nr:(2Fe-2S) ferredoxin domain-containing protein [Capillibacterium thermochitinicola]MBA2133611.1 (2Fe-2S) ferredoxin domain-containing protein [Capillibacterium thermochitinicola]
MTSLAELEKIRDQARRLTELRGEKPQTKVVIGMGTCGIAAGARETMKAILDEINKRNLTGIAVTPTGCLGLCEQEPIVEVEIPDQPRIVYGKISAEKARQIVAKHLVNNNIIDEWVIGRK